MNLVRLTFWFVLLTQAHGTSSIMCSSAIQVVEEQCQMRLGRSEILGAAKPILAWLLRHPVRQLSRYKSEGNGKEVYGEHYSHKKYFPRKSFL